jgi:wyosine [tRNA(Phe)-imidazoG37] synthetase (radical SAM superfamily)
MKIELVPSTECELGDCLIIDPFDVKTCNWDCVYCPLGPTVLLTNERVYSPPPREILAEIRSSLRSKRDAPLDWVLFKACGEPTLHIGFGWLLEQVNQITDLPSAVLTNGALLNLPEVRAELSVADAVLLRLDAGSRDLFAQINRPHPEIKFHDLLRGISAFREKYRGPIWAQVTLIQEMNDTPLALERLGVVLNRLQPKGIHLHLPTDQSTEPWVRPTDEAGLMRAAASLGDISPIRHPAANADELKMMADPRSALLWLLERHAMRIQEIYALISAWKPSDLADILMRMEASGRVHRGQRYGDNFWRATGRMIPGEPHGIFHDSPSTSVGLNTMN